MTRHCGGRTTHHGEEPAQAKLNEQEANVVTNTGRRKIVVMEDHDDVYYYWMDNNIKNVELVHIDPHCDLYGALIHTSDQYLLQIRNEQVNEGNWLVHAIKEGMVRKITWVFDEYGDRKFDDTTVKFDTDFSSKLPIARHKQKKLKKIPIEFSKTKIEDWNGFPEGEHLSLAWDFFSFIVKDKNKIRETCEEFVVSEWKVTPEVTIFANLMVMSTHPASSSSTSSADWRKNLMPKSSTLSPNRTVLRYPARPFLARFETRSTARAAVGSGSGASINAAGAGIALRPAQINPTSVRCRRRGRTRADEAMT